MTKEALDELAFSYISMMCGARTIGWEYRTELRSTQEEVLNFISSLGSERAAKYLETEKEERAKREELRRLKDEDKDKA